MIPLVFALSLAAVQSSDTALTRELTQIEERLRATWQKDCDGWGALLADEWSVIHITARIITKAEALQMCRTPDAPIEARYDDLSIRGFGDAAVVTGRTTASTRGPNAQTVEFRYTDFFVRRNGKWLIVASQATPIR